MVKIQEIIDLIERVDEQHYPSIRDFIYRSVHPNGIHLLYKPSTIDFYTREESLRQVESIYDVVVFAEDNTDPDPQQRAKKHAVRAFRERFGVGLHIAERELEHWLQTRRSPDRF